MINIFLFFNKFNVLYLTMNQNTKHQTMPVICLILIAFHSTADVFDVVAQDNNFSPANISIQAGDTVRWENLGAMNHNVASTDLNYLFRCADGCDDTGGNGNPLGNGWISEVTFHKSNGSIPYVCEPHVGFGMTGSIAVQTPQEYAAVEVNIGDGFVPQNLTIAQYDRVKFSNGGGEHNVAADDDSFRCADGCRDDGVEGVDVPLGFDWEFFMQFNQPGIYTYHCDNPEHNESGIIEVISEVIFANGFESN